MAGERGRQPASHRTRRGRAAGRTARLARRLPDRAVERDAMMVAGFGFRRGATLASLRDALAQALEVAQPATPAHAITLLAAAQDKAEAPCLRALATDLGLPLCAVAPAHVANTPTLTNSAAVRALRGTGSTAEAAAL